MGSGARPEPLSASGSERSRVNRHDREAILARIDREGATVGARIPERLEVAERTVDLRERVLAAHRSAADAAPDAESPQSLIVDLRRERLERRRRIEEDQTLDREGAEALAESIVGIDRALAALEHIGSESDIEAEIDRRTVADRRRWRQFLKKANANDLRERGRR